MLYSLGRSVKLLLALDSTVNLGFGSIFLSFLILLRVLKWGLLFNERQGLTTTGHSLTDLLCQTHIDLTAKLMLALGSTLILGSESHGTHDHILLPDGSRSVQATLTLYNVDTGSNVK
jgi:hypothetical protein